ncbi:MAG: TonB-dependent receptor [Candidatus Cloacimonetes bacterium]|nr:TonB-dependent receptor [Candidatus Cloacimonadota bacterium]
MQKKLLLIAVYILLIGVSLFAQTTGRLSGRVLNESGEGLSGINVIIAELQIGTVTDLGGRFMIINITPGVYTVQVMGISFATHVLENVRVSLDDTRTLPNIVLRRETVDMEIVTVVAQDVMLNTGTPGTVTSMTQETLSNVAVSDIEGAIAMTAGVNQGPDGSLNVRGGRSNEVVWTIDGMSVSDPVDGGRAMSIDMDMVAEMRVMTGGFTAEFGNAQSGMINIITRDGTENWEGRVEALTDHIFNDGSNYDELKFSIGGPFPVYFFNPSLRSKFTFFLNGAAAWDDTRFRDHYRSSANEDLRYLSGSVYDVYDPYSERDSFLGFELGNRNNNSYNLNLKTTYNFNHFRKLTLAIRGDRNYRTPFSHQWRYALDHYAEIDTRQSQVMFTYDHTFDARKTLQVRGSYFNNNVNQKPRGIKGNEYLLGDWLLIPENGYAFHGWRPIANSRDRVYEDRFPDRVNWEYNIQGLADSRPVRFFNAPGTIWDNYIDDEASQITLKADFEYQHSQIIGGKTGFEIIRHDIQKNQLLSFLYFYDDRYDKFLDENCIPERYIYNPDNPDNPIPVYSAEDYYSAAVASHGYRDGYRANPIQFAYYVQSRMDWEGMIVNAGVRMDLWYLGQSYDILQDDGSFRKKDFDSGDRTQLMISPRLGVSHPISERDVIHFNYNYQNQLPQMRFIFTTRDSIDAYQETGISVGNPALEPQITITYEVGLQRLLSDDYILGITAYYKNIYNYVSLKKVQSQEEATVEWYEYESQDYGSARGLDFTINRRMFNFISGGLAYSIAWANGNNSDTPTNDLNQNLREFPLDWDIRHVFNANAIFRVARGEEWMVPFTSWVFPVDDFTVSVNYTFSSGRPYTPMSQEVDTLLATNSKRMPSTSNANLSIAKNFPTGGTTFIRASLLIENLFKKNNVNSVWARTGSPYYDGSDLSEILYPGYVFEETQFIHDEWTRNPGNVNNSRNYIFGLSFNF